MWWRIRRGSCSVGGEAVGGSDREDNVPVGVVSSDDAGCAVNDDALPAGSSTQGGAGDDPSVDGVGSEFAAGDDAVGDVVGDDRRGRDQAALRGGAEAVPEVVRVTSRTYSGVVVGMGTIAP